jgi:hypothetical protein
VRCVRVQRHACVYHENLIRLGTRGAGSGRGVLGTSCVTLFSCTNVPYPCVVESPRRSSPSPNHRPQWDDDAGVCGRYERCVYVLRVVQVQRPGRRPHVARCPARPTHRGEVHVRPVVGCTSLRVSRQSHVHSVHIVSTSGEARRRADALNATHSDPSVNMGMVSLQRAAEQCRSLIPAHAA